jgi:hypothetical protein
MMDELRDYRFYEADLIHPNTQAIEYIFERFVQTYFDKKLQNFLNEWKKIKGDLGHKLFNEADPKSQQFLKNLLIKLDQISEKVNIENERKAVLSRIFV